MTLPAGFRLGLPEELEWLRGTDGMTGWWLIADGGFGDEHFSHLGCVSEELLTETWDASLVVRWMVERAVGSSVR